MGFSFGLFSTILFLGGLSAENYMAQTRAKNWLHSFLISQSRIFPTDRLNQYFEYFILLCSSQLFYMLAKIIIINLNKKYLHRDFAAMTANCPSYSLFFSLVTALLVSSIFTVLLLDIRLLVPIFLAYCFSLIVFQATHNQGILISTCYLVNATLIAVNFLS